MAAHNLFINVPYPMVRSRIESIVALHMGVEVYLSNATIDEVEKPDAAGLARLLSSSGVACTCHAPYMDLSPGGVDRHIKEISKEKLKKSIGIAQVLGAKGIVCHGGYDRWRFGGQEGLWLDNSVNTWTELLAEAGDLPVMIENVFEETPSTIVALLDVFRGKNLFSCFDTGHFNLFTKISLDEWLLPLRGRLKELHIHDNHGGSDEHLPVGRGTFPFRELKRILPPADDLLFTAETPSESSAVDTIRCAREFLS